MTQPTPALLLGGTGYVSGEILRLLAAHPNLELASVTSDSSAGVEVETAFPHLRGAYPGLSFSARREIEELLEGQPLLACFSALPHGASARVVDEVLAGAQKAGAEITLVDLSADFRFPEASDYEAIYGAPHGAPHRLPGFRCAVPEHLDDAGGLLVGHPGCFTTAVVLAAVPLLLGGWIEPEIHVAAVTGSTGSGRTPGTSTHHPERRSTLYAYKPLAHRHAPEMHRLVRQASGVEAKIHFVPHSGPFARGIHATLQARPARRASGEELEEVIRRYYRDAPFVQVPGGPPRLQDVVGTNLCRLGASASADAVVVFSVLDNLVKGAAGGAVQWMNRLLGLPETAGLTQPGLGWL